MAGDRGALTCSFHSDDYALDTDRRELTRGSELISIGPQVFDLLVYLVQNRERVVSKDDLLEGGLGWADRLRIDADQPHQCRAQGGRRQRRRADA